MKAVRIGLSLAVLWVRCNDPHPRPTDLQVIADMRPKDADPAESADLAGAMCTRCDAVLNPCPVLGLDCNAVTGCCVPKAAQCVPRYRQCLAPATCCAGLSCVGGTCAKVGP